MGVSKVGLFYAISGFPVGFKNYVGVLLHIVLYMAAGGLDYFNVPCPVRYLLYSHSDTFMAVFNPVLFAGVKFGVSGLVILSVVYPFVALILITWAEKKLRATKLTT